MRRLVVPAVTAMIAVSLSSASSRADEDSVTVVVRTEGARVDGRVLRGVWAPLCTAPCEVRVAPGSTLRLTTREGDVRSVGISADAGERVVVEEPDELERRATARWLGFGAVIAGGVTTQVGVLWMLLGTWGHACSENLHSGSSSCDNRPEKGATYMTIAGLAVVAVGGVILASAPAALRRAPPLAPPPAPIEARTPPPSATTALLRPPAPPTTTLVTVRF